MLRSAGLLLRRAGQASRSSAWAGSKTYANVPDDAEIWSRAGPAVQSPDAIGLHGRYAVALFSAAMDGSEARVNLVDKDLQAVASLAERSEGFRIFLKDPTIPRKKKAADLDSFLTELKVCETTKSFFALLTENNRLGDFMKIHGVFTKIVSGGRGQVTATITTADPLDPATVEDVKRDLKGILKQGETLILNQNVDPAIIGGIILDIGDKHLDMSLISRVRQLERLILAGPN